MGSMAAKFALIDMFEIYKEKLTCAEIQNSERDLECICKELDLRVKEVSQTWSEVWRTIKEAYELLSDAWQSFGAFLAEWESMTIEFYEDEKEYAAIPPTSLTSLKLFYIISTRKQIRWKRHIYGKIFKWVVIDEKRATG